MKRNLSLEVNLDHSFRLLGHDKKKRPLAFYNKGHAFLAFACSDDFLCYICFTFVIKSNPQLSVHEKQSDFVFRDTTLHITSLNRVRSMSFAP